MLDSLDLELEDAQLCRAGTLPEGRQGERSEGGEGAMPSPRREPFEAARASIMLWQRLAQPGLRTVQPQRTQGTPFGLPAS